NFLRSSDSVHARKMKTKIPRNEIRFCIAAALYLCYGTGNAPNHFIRQLGIDRKGQGLLRRSFTGGKVPGVMAERLEALLQMEGNGIIDLAPDLLRFQVIDQRIATRV